MKRSGKRKRRNGGRPIAHKGTALVHKGVVLVLRDMLTVMATETASQITVERENPQPTEEQAAPDVSTTTWQESG